MAFSINNRLTTFAQQDLVLGYNDTERSSINASLGQLEKVLKDGLKPGILEVKRFGSFTRNTILPRKYDANSDVDIMVIFNSSNGTKTPGTYRKNIMDVVQGAYPKSTVKKDFPTVKLELNHIMFDIVPAYKTNSWQTFHYIPSANDQWQTTEPNDLNELLGQKNQTYGNNIVRNVIRLCKHWNASAGYPYESYVMEKWIVNRYFYQGDNLYDKFLSVLNDWAGGHAGVSNSLKWINEYKGSWSRQPDEMKQFEWLQKLLPGLK